MAIDPRLHDAPDGGGEVFPDTPARDAAVDPEHNVVLEASAGTGKTRVLVTRYVNLIRRGVDPRNILAITFTRAAAAEMRDRILSDLRTNAGRSEQDATRWRDLRDRLGEIAVCTIDAFCLLLLREFPLEADLDPDFQVADETAVATLVEESLDSTLRIARSQARTAPELALLFAQLGEPRLRAGLSALLERRLVADRVLGRVLRHGPLSLTVESVCARGAERIVGALGDVPGGLEAFLGGGPADLPRFAMLAASARSHAGGASTDTATVRMLVDQISAHVLTQAGTPRNRLPSDCKEEWFAGGKKGRAAHLAAVKRVGPVVLDAINGFRRDINLILSHALARVFAIARARHEHTLDLHGVLDFGALLTRATALLGQMDEFARSRFLLEARYHHVLVDEFQDTSRAQWGLVSQLVRTWGQGVGLAHEGPLAPSIFIVGDRKQSIYGFRDAEVKVLAEAAAVISELRTAEDPRHSISYSFRSVAPLLAFANDLFESVTKQPERPDAFVYDSQDAFPNSGAGEPRTSPVLGLVASAEVGPCAAAVAQEVARLLRAHTVIRDRQTREHRAVRPGDIAILFRSRASHREYEQALEDLAVPSYVYKGLGFFSSDEIRDVMALIRYLADPVSDLRAAALLRSRLVRLSDPALQMLSPGVARAISGRREPEAAAMLRADDRATLELVRANVGTWLALTDRLPPAEVLDRILADTAYLYEIRGARSAQARENVKKIRGLVRRIQNRGYLTLAALAAELDRIGTGDESNATVDALDAVNLMTVHAAKGLEFPVVFVVNLGRGTRGGRDPIRIAPDAPPEDAVSIGDFTSENDDDAGERDTEETKRLLYVAITRARDRLYLSSLVKDGKVPVGRRSLATVIPGSLLDAVAKSAEDGGASHEVAWQGPSGVRHRFHCCHALPRGLVEPLGDGFRPDQGERPAADFAPIADEEAPVRVRVTDLVRPGDPAEPRPLTGGDPAALIAGSLVHRLFQFEVDPSDAAEARARALALLDDEERDELGDPDVVVDRAVAVYSGMRNRPEVRALLDSARCYYEVPVSFGLVEAPGQIARGVIDCVAYQPDGSVVVIDFKTGVPRESDARQLDLYVDAVRQMCAGQEVRAALLYPA